MATATGIANDTVKQKRSKAMEMRYYWIKDKTERSQFRIVWKAGKTNKADYFTKRHPATHHRETRPLYVTDAPANAHTMKLCTTIGPDIDEVAHLLNALTLSYRA